MKKPVSARNERALNLAAIAAFAARRQRVPGDVRRSAAGILSGETHCGTNAYREPHAAAWWGQPMTT